MGWDMSNILVNLSSNGGGGGGSDPELASRVTALETTVGDASGGLVKDVDDLETETDALDTRVTALEQGGGGGEYTVVPLEPKTPSSTNYEDFATITLPAGNYHVIAGVYNGSDTYPTTGIRIYDGSLLCCQTEATGMHNPCCMGFFSNSAEKTYKIQIRGNSSGGATGGYYMYKSVPAYTPTNNTRKRSTTK